MPDDKSTVKVFVEMLARHFVQEQTASAGLMAFDTNWIEHAFLCRGVGSKQPLVKIRFKCVEQRPKIEPLGVLDIHQYGRNSGEDIFRERIFPQSADVRRSPNKQVRNRVNQAIDIVSLRRRIWLINQSLHSSSDSKSGAVAASINLFFKSQAMMAFRSNSKSTPSVFILVA